MGYAIETVAAFVSDAASTGAQAMAAATGQSLNVRACNGTNPASLETVWAPFQDAGDFRLRSPRLHDDVNAMRWASPGLFSQPVAEEFFAQPLYSQDTLIAEAFFTVAPTAGHISQAFLQVYYQDLPGVAGNYQTQAELAPKIQSWLVIPVTCTSNASAGQWGAGVAINSSVDVFKANSLYALYGVICPTQFGGWSILGTDLGNLMVGGPGSTETIETRCWFARQEQFNGMASIPVINSQNKGATLVQVADRQLSTAFEISLVFAYCGNAS